MASSSQLRNNVNQHKPKNSKSKKDDKAIRKAMDMVIKYLNNRFLNVGNFNEYEIIYAQKLTIGEMIENIKNSNVRKEFDSSYSKNGIEPDGGFLILKKRDEERYQKLLLAAEVKRQGTNKDRIKEGKEKQAQGNAIERLGKNLTGIKAMMNHEDITPFVCFGQGCDFSADSSVVLAKISTMNEFYYLNRTYIFKKDGNSDNNKFAPVSMYFREKDWNENEMYEIMKEIAETSLRYYIF